MNDNKAEALPLALYINGNNNSNQSSNNKGNRDISSNDRGQFVELLRNMKPSSGWTRGQQLPEKENQAETTSQTYGRQVWVKESRVRSKERALNQKEEKSNEWLSY